jgi:hypothetical protein
MMFPKRKWGAADYSADVKVPESALQCFLDEYLELKKIRSIRIPDNVFRWVQVSAPLWFRIYFNKTFGGLPDKLLLFPDGKYMRAVPIELKTIDGKLHGKQKARARAENWIICRTVNEIVAAVDAALYLLKEVDEAVPDIQDQQVAKLQTMAAAVELIEAGKTPDSSVGREQTANKPSAPEA